MILGFPKYRISQDGIITNIEKNKVISQFISSQGYPTCTLYNENKKQNKKIHRLLAEAYIPNFNGEMVDHINMIKTDYRLSNLRITNYLQNLHNRNPVQKNGLPTGVYKIVKKDKTSYKAMITCNYLVCQKLFDSLEKAVMFRCLKRIEYGLIQ
jgi:hypothetical protein